MIDLSSALSGVLDDHDAPYCPPGFARASSAGGCARQEWYRIHQEPVSNPTSLTGRLAMETGTFWGKQLAEALDLACCIKGYGNATAEAYWERGHVSGHADGVYHAEGLKHVVEFKTIVNPFAAKFLPKREHILQASINAYALGAQLIHVTYLILSPKKGEAALIELEPRYDAENAAAELARLDAITQCEELPAPEYEGQIIPPFFDDYPCSYCAFRDTCKMAG